MGWRTEGTDGTNRGGATAHGTRRRERRGRVDNPPYGTAMMREGGLRETMPGGLRETQNFASLQAGGNGWNGGDGGNGRGGWLEAASIVADHG